MTDFVELIWREKTNEFIWRGNSDPVHDDLLSGAQKVYQCHTGILCKHYSVGFRIHSASGIVFCQYVKFIIAIDSRLSDLYSLWDADGTYHGISGQYGGLWGNDEAAAGIEAIKSGIQTL